MQIVHILRFGPGIVELEAQQEIQDRVLGKVAPTLKPLVDGNSIDVESVEPHAELSGPSKGGGQTANKGNRRNAAKTSRSGGRVSGGPSRSGSGGDR